MNDRRDEETRPIGLESLKQQADQLRRSALMTSPSADVARSNWQEGVYALIALGLVILAAVLLMAGDLRRSWSAALLRMAGVGETTREEQILKLPPPPPKPIEPRAAVAQAPESTFGAKPAPAPRKSRPEPEVASKPAESLRQQPAGAPEEKAPPLTRGAEAQKAYALLLEKSAVARALSGNQNESYSFKDWKLVRTSPPDYWIDLTSARKADGQEVHFTWSVDVESGQVKPLSQAARDVETKPASR
ncbi:MAG: hypothetical protein HY645_15145 [Acidobacteria bacterium]|nr:hypothetical protein [Acidobacteriota bacterium]